MAGPHASRRWQAEYPVTAAALVCAIAKGLWAGHLIQPEAYPPHHLRLISTIGVIALVWAPFSWMRLRWRAWAAVGLDVAVTLVALVDLWHVRFYGDLPSVLEAVPLRQFVVVPSSVRAIALAGDALLCLDLIVLVAVMRYSWATAPIKRSWNALLACLVVFFCCGVLVFRTFRHDPDEVFGYQFQRIEIVGAVGLAGYHAYDVAMTVLFPVRGRLGVRPGEAESIAHLITERRSAELNSRLRGVARGLNVILISAESLEGFTLDMSINGAPLTPNLAAFARDSLTFNEFYDQTHLGTTSDAEFITLNSLLPLSAGTVATRFPSNTFRALPSVLHEAGYATLSACGEPPAFWNMRNIHARYGFERSWFLQDFPTGPWVGVGLDDAVFLDRMAETLSSQPQPFLAFLLTSSNHHPYNLPQRLRALSPEPWPETMAGDYLESVHYSDRAFGQFVDALRTSGVLDRSMVVVYGDHQSWMSDEDLQRLWQSAGHATSASELELWQFRRRVPLMIHLPRGAEAGARSVPGGHLDVAPTILSLLGIKDRTVPWLGHDLTAPHRSLIGFRDATVTDGQTFAIASPSGPVCTARNGSPVSCSFLTPLIDESNTLFVDSDRLILGDLAPSTAQQLARIPVDPPRAPAPVLVIAHRGDSRHFPENTTASIRSGFDLGADMVEVDVRLTRDGVPMIFHDDDTIARTTNGKGLFETHTRAEIQSLDAGSWMSPRFAGLRVPTLVEALAAAKGGRLYLDLKSDGLAKAIAAAYATAGVAQDRATVATWTAEQQREFARDMPGAKVVAVRGAPIAWGSPLFDDLRSQHIWALETDDDRPPAFVGDAALHGFPTLTYTVNDEPTMRRLIEMGIGGIETDDPALLIKIAKELKAR